MLLVYKAIGTVAAGAATGGVIAGLPGIIIGIAVAVAGAAIANTLGDK